MHAIRFKARHLAWKQDGTNYNPYVIGRARTPSMPRRLMDEESGGIQHHGKSHVFEGANHSDTCLQSPHENPDIVEHNPAGGERLFKHPNHASTMPTGQDTEGMSVNGFKPSQRALDKDSSAINEESAVRSSESSGEKPRRRHIRNPFKKNSESSDSPVLEKEITNESKRSRQPQKFTVWGQLRATVFGSYVNLLLICVPVGIALNYAKVAPLAVFLVNFLAIVPLAGMLSYATEEIALRVGETLGGLLNASFGNAVELIVAIISLTHDEYIIVQTSLIGSMLSNLLLVLGMCFFFGGLKRSEQFFNITVAQTAASLLALSVSCLIIPTVFVSWASPETDQLLDAAGRSKKVPEISHGVSIIMLLVYGCYLLFQLKTHASMYNEPSQKVPKRPSKKIEEGAASGKVAAMGLGLATGHAQQESIFKNESDEDDDDEEIPQLSVWGAIITLAVSTAFVGICAEFMVDNIGEVCVEYNISPEFVGLILIPIVGNAAEHATAVTVAIKDKMDLAIGVAVGSSLQIALFVLPLSVLLGWIMGKGGWHYELNDDGSFYLNSAGQMVPELEMTLDFDGFLVVLLFVSVLLVNYLIGDGKSHWLEGVLLMAIYTIIAVAAWYYPADAHKILGT